MVIPRIWGFLLLANNLGIEMCVCVCCVTLIRKYEYEPCNFPTVSAGAREGDEDHEDDDEKKRIRRKKKTFMCRGIVSHADFHSVNQVPGFGKIVLADLRPGELLFVDGYASRVGKVLFAEF